MNRLITVVVLAICASAITDAGLTDIVKKVKEGRRLNALIKQVTRANGAEDKEFWKYAASSSLNKCNRDFAWTLRENLYNNGGQNDADKLELNRLVQQKTMHDCCEAFADRVETWNDIQQSIGGLVTFADGYRPDAEDEADVVLRISRVMRETIDQTILDRDTFESIYNRKSPCAQFYNIIHDDEFDYVDYLQFLRLASLPDYYPLTSDVHRDNVKILALCDHINNTGGLLDHAYAAYENGN